MITRGVTENHGVAGSIPALATTIPQQINRFYQPPDFWGNAGVTLDVRQ
jgi:hypothetical protein